MKQLDGEKTTRPSEWDERDNHYTTETGLQWVGLELASVFLCYDWGILYLFIYYSFTEI